METSTQSNTSPSPSTLQDQADRFQGTSKVVQLLPNFLRDLEIFDRELAAGVLDVRQAFEDADAMTGVFYTVADEALTAIAPREMQFIVDCQNQKEKSCQAVGCLLILELLRSHPEILQAAVEEVYARLLMALEGR